MDNQSLSLDQLQDILLPTPPPFWPPAPGIWLLLGLILLLLVLGFVAARRHHRRNQYRMAGLALLQQATSDREINIILKRVSLAAFARVQVASLYGEEWFAFLNHSCSRCQFARHQPTDGQTLTESFRSTAALWIRHHKTSPAGRALPG